MQKSQIVRIVITLAAAVGVYLLAGRIIDAILAKGADIQGKMPPRSRSKAPKNGAENTQIDTDLSEKLAYEITPGNGELSEVDESAKGKKSN